MGKFYDNIYLFDRIQAVLLPIDKICSSKKSPKHCNFWPLLGQQAKIKQQKSYISSQQTKGHEKVESKLVSLCENKFLIEFRDK